MTIPSMGKLIDIQWWLRELLTEWLMMAKSEGDPFCIDVLAMVGDFDLAWKAGIRPMMMEGGRSYRAIWRVWYSRRFQWRGLWYRPILLCPTTDIFPLYSRPFDATWLMILIVVHYLFNSIRQFCWPFVPFYYSIIHDILFHSFTFLIHSIDPFHCPDDSIYSLWDTFGIYYSWRCLFDRYRCSMTTDTIRGIPEEFGETIIICVLIVLRRDSLQFEWPEAMLQYCWHLMAIEGGEEFHSIDDFEDHSFQNVQWHSWSIWRRWWLVFGRRSCCSIVHSGDRYDHSASGDRNW